MDAFDVLGEFVNDIESAYLSSQNDSEIDEEKLGWPDLMITYHHAKMVLSQHESEEKCRVTTLRRDMLATRRLLDRISEKFGQYAFVELCEDGSGFIGDKMGGGSKVVEFDGLGELTTILETPLEDL